MMKERDTAAVLREFGRLLYEDAPDWQARMAPAIRVNKNTLQKWQSGAVPLSPDHPALRDLLAHAERRAKEMEQAAALLRSASEHPPQHPPEPSAEYYPTPLVSHPICRPAARARRGSRSWQTAPNKQVD